MNKSTLELGEIKLVGIKVRTNNLQEMNPLTAKIGSTIQKYFQGGIATQIPNRVKPGVTFSVYTDYESDHTGNYTYFLGEEVSCFDSVPETLETYTILKQSYTKFTTEPGPLPGVVIAAWQKIWMMDTQSLGGERRYHADFEIYDERAANLQQAVVDIYIGIKN